jgi:hypothetical protein
MPRFERVTKNAAWHEAMQAGEVEIPTVHDVDGARLEDQIVKHGHIRTFSLGNLHDRRDHAAQIELRVQLDRGVAMPIVRPRKDGDRGR